MNTAEILLIWQQSNQSINQSINKNQSNQSINISLLFTGCCTFSAREAEYKENSTF
jgi:hypothetical protein